MPFERFVVTMKEGGRRLLCVTATPRGPLVDYQAFARHCSADFDKLVSGHAGEEVRVFAGSSFYFNHAFSSDNEWSAYGLENPDWPAQLTGYARKNSVTDQVLREMLKKAPKQRVIVMIDRGGNLKRCIVGRQSDHTAAHPARSAVNGKLNWFVHATNLTSNRCSEQGRVD